MAEPIITLGEFGELDLDDAGNVILRNTATNVEITLSDVVDIENDQIRTRDIQNAIETSTAVGISHRYFYGPDDPRDDPDIEVREGDVWYDTSDLE